MKELTERNLSPLRKQVADVLRRARKLPVGPDRNDLRQLAIGLMWLERRGARTEGRAVGLFQSAESRGEAAHRQSDRDLDIKADEALEAARALPAGKAKVEAMKRAGLLRKAADDREIRFAKRGRPPKKFPR